jgi:branched-chain amino acid transport system substrate-binding protein
MVLGNVGFKQNGDIAAPGYVLYVWKSGKFVYADAP